MKRLSRNDGLQYPAYSITDDFIQEEDHGFDDDVFNSKLKVGKSVGDLLYRGASPVSMFSRSENFKNSGDVKVERRSVSLSTSTEKRRCERSTSMQFAVKKPLSNSDRSRSLTFVMATEYQQRNLLENHLKQKPKDEEEQVNVFISKYHSWLSDFCKRNHLSILKREMVRHLA